LCFAIDRFKSIFNLKSAIEIMPGTPKSGQGAKYPDRFFAKAAKSLIKFFGSNASALNTPLT
jgi:hypothetical protein